MQRMIELDNVTFRWSPDALPALDGVTLRIPEGQYVALMGANGSGKSTLARHLNGLLLPQAGRVRVGDLDTAVPDQLWHVRERVGMVFQNPDHQMVSTVVQEEVAFGPENLGLPPSEIRARVEEALGAVRLQDLRMANPAHLSGGQKQRVAIASILAMRPAVMVLDEPTAMLDAESRHDVLATLRALRGERAVTVVLVTHAVDEALDADRVVVLEAGRVAHDGSSREVLPRMLDADRSLLPPAMDLLRRLRAAGLPVADPVTADPEEAARRILAALDMA